MKKVVKNCENCSQPTSKEDMVHWRNMDICIDCETKLLEEKSYGTG